MAEHRKMNHNDRRVKRTKKALHDALLTLLNEKSINEITVTELTSLADVNRATFYFYYTDLIDMLQQIQNEAYESFSAVVKKASVEVSTIDGFTEYAERLLLFCEENEALVRFIVNNDVNSRLYTYIRELLLTNAPDTKKIFGESNPAKYLSNFVITAMIGICIDWLDDGMKVSAHDLAKLCANVYINGSYKTKQLLLSHTEN